MAMATSSDSKINLLMANGHFITKWQMATSLSIMANGHITNYGKWPLLYQLWQNGHFLLQMANDQLLFV